MNYIFTAFIRLQTCPFCGVEPEPIYAANGPDDNEIVGGKCACTIINE